MFVGNRRRDPAFPRLCLALIACAAPFLTACSGNSTKDEYAAERTAYTAARQRTPARLMDDLRSRDYIERTAAADRLGEIKAPGAVRPLAEALTDPAQDVRLAAARALGAIRDPAAVDPLCGVLRSADTDLRIAAARALVRLRDLRAIRPMLDAADTGEPLYAALASFGEPAIPELIASLNDPERRPPAAAVLAHLGPPAVGPLVQVLERHQNKRARMAAAWALGEIDDNRAASTLLEAFRKEDPELLAAAYRPFLRQRPPGSEKILVKALLSEGDLKMAEAFMASGNGELRRGAEEWFKKSGYVAIDTRSGEASRDAGASESREPAHELALFHFDGSYASTTGLAPSESKQTAFVPGRWGSAVTAGQGGILRYPMAGAWDLRNGTVELWISPTRDGSDPVYTQFNHTLLLYTASNGDQFAFSESIRRGFYAGSIVGGQFEGVGGGDMFAWKPGDWHHLAFTYSAKGRQRLYIDGTLVSERNGALPLPGAGSAGFHLASDPAGHASAFTVDELRISGDEKTPGAIQYDADRERPFTKNDVYRLIAP